MKKKIKRLWQFKSFRFDLPIGVAFGAGAVLAYVYFPADKDWLDFIGVLATALVGVAAVYIASQQHSVKQLEWKFFKNKQMLNDFILLRNAIDDVIEELDFKSPNTINYSNVETKANRVADRVFDLKASYGSKFSDRLLKDIKIVINEKTSESLQQYLDDWKEFRAITFARCMVKIEE